MPRKDPAELKLSVPGLRRNRKRLRAAGLPIVLALVCLASSACSSWQSSYLKTVDPLPLEEFDSSLKARKAYALLRDTTTFSSAHVGPAGVPSQQVVAFQTLLSSASADEGFKLLLKHANLEGQLYGLSGLYFTDRAAFQREVERYRAPARTVFTHFGCEIGNRPLSSVIGSSAAVVAPEDLPAWREENPLAEYPLVDIATGGWPTEFRDAYKKR